MPFHCAAYMCFHSCPDQDEGMTVACAVLCFSRVMAHEMISSQLQLVAFGGCYIFSYLDTVILIMDRGQNSVSCGLVKTRAEKHVLLWMVCVCGVRGSGNLSGNTPPVTIPGQQQSTYFGVPVAFLVLSWEWCSSLLWVMSKECPCRKDALVQSQCYTYQRHSVIGSAEHTGVCRIFTAAQHL